MRPNERLFEHKLFYYKGGPGSAVLCVKQLHTYATGGHMNTFSGSSEVPRMLANNRGKAIGDMKIPVR